VSTVAAPTLPERIRRSLDDFHGRLRGRFGERLRDYRLFGSYARGDEGPDSDVDVLVVIDGLDHHGRGEVFDLCEDVFFVHEVPLSPLALSTTEWQLLVQREYLLARDIQAEGIAL
jgi:predicted nucleotidyltransferase